MKHFAVLCVGIGCLIVTSTSFGLMAPIGLNQFSVSWRSYPKAAFGQLESALKADGCRFISGHWTNGSIKLQFAGETVGLNEMLKRLANCPAVSLSVSFENSDQPADWRVDFAARDPHVQVIVNLKSKNMVLERLVIPAAKGPELESSSVASPATK
jgi:hypothetical protein